MIVALRTQIDVGVVLVREGGGGRDEIVVRGGQRIAQLEGSGGIGLMRVMADTANDGDIGVTSRKGLVV